MRTYDLCIPNLEVENSFLTQLAPVYAGIDDTTSVNYQITAARALIAGDAEKFIKILRNFFANIPYSARSPTGGRLFNRPSAQVFNVVFPYRTKRLSTAMGYAPIDTLTACKSRSDAELDVVRPLRFAYKRTGVRFPVFGAVLGLME